MRLVTCDLALACCINFGRFTRLARRVQPIFALSSLKGVAGLYAAPDGPTRPPITQGNLPNAVGELERIHEVVWVRRDCRTRALSMARGIFGLSNLMLV